MNQPCHYREGELFFEELSLQNLAKTYQTPFYLYSERTINSNFLEFKNAAESLGLEEPLVCFALKSNPNPQLLKSLAKLGSGADIVSGGELKRALECEIDPQKIVFSGVGKSLEEMEMALNSHENGIYSFNVESLSELRQLSDVAKKLNKKARVALRLNPQVNAKTHKHISTGFKTHKFGLISSEVIEAFKQPSFWEHCQLVGLSMHIGSQLTCLKATKKALKELSKVALESPYPLEFLDVGGGLGVDYSPNDREVFHTPHEYMELIFKTLKKHFFKPANYTPRLVFEPGRVISARSGVLVTKVIRQKNSENHHFIIVDGGMNDFVRTSLYEAYHEVYPSPQRKGKKVLCDIVGPICETADCFASSRKITPVQDGDLVVIGDTGAYGFSMASNYNLRALPKEYVLTKEGNLLEKS